jgi:aspartyl-tRNA(Asn)/glutamyl-tRNA(Gln) amidotransferase subunit C
MSDPTASRPDDVLGADAVRRVAHLSRLSLDDSALERYATQLGAILGHVRQLQDLDLDDVEPLTHPLDATNRLDADAARPPLDREALLKMAPDAAAPFIRVPKIIGNDGGA